MKVIIAGSRTIRDYRIVLQAIQLSGFDISEVVSGGALGVDLLGERYARDSNIPVRQFLPDWKSSPRGAGMIRNSEMAAYADALIAVWDGKSRGTMDMIKKAEKRGLKVYTFATGFIPANG